MPAGGKLPYLDKVLIKIIVEPSTLVAALKTGEVDLINYASPQFVGDLRKDPKLTALSAVGGNWVCMHMNIAKEPFNDKALRKAVTFAIDRKEILEKVEFGEGIVAHGPISPPMGGFYDAAFESGKNGQYFDLEQAKSLMKQAKYDGRELLLLSVNTGTAPRRAEVVQAHLAKIGVKVRIELADFPTFRRRWLQERQWDLVQVQWDADLDPDETLYPELHSTEAWNAGKWVNKEFDRAVEAARSGARLQEAQEVLRRRGQGHPRGRAGGHPATRQRAEDPPQARQGLPDDPGRPDQHAPGLARQGVRLEPAPGPIQTGAGVLAW